MAEYSEYKDSGQQWLGMVPSHWNLQSVNSVLKEQKELVGKRNDLDLLSLTLNGVIYRDKFSGIGKMPSDFESYKIIKPNDLIFCLFDLDETPRTVGVAHQHGMITGAYDVFSSEDNLLIQFLYYYFLAIDNDKALKPYYSGLRKVVKINRFKHIQIPIPPKEEQKAIVAYLDRVTADIDKAIAAKERIIASLEERRKIIITDAVTHGINPDAPMKDSGIDWLGEIPAHWEVIKLGALGSTVNGVSSDSSYFGTGYPFVSYSDVYKNFALPKSVSGLANSTPHEQKIYSVQSGDIFFTRTSETAEEIGFSSVCIDTIPKAVFAGFLIRFRPKKDVLYPLFSKYYFRSSIHRSYFVKEMNLVIRASLSQKLLRGLPILLPPLDEQVKIAEHLEIEVGNINRLIRITFRQIELLRERKNIIINETVTGKVKVI